MAYATFKIGKFIFKTDLVKVNIIPSFIDPFSV